MLVGLCPNPICSASCDAGCALVPNAFITKRNDRLEIFYKEGLWSVVVYRDFAFSVLHFSSVRPDHIAGRGEQLFYHQSYKERCREGDNLLQRRHYIEHQPFYSAYYKCIGYWGARMSTAM